jgi:hypothetical protein
LLAWGGIASKIWRKVLVTIVRSHCANLQLWGHYELCVLSIALVVGLLQPCTLHWKPRCMVWIGRIPMTSLCWVAWKCLLI